MTATQLATRHAFLQTLIDAIPSPVFYKDTAGRYLGCNAAFLEFLGCRSEDLLGKSVFELSPPDLAAKYHAMDAALFEAPGKQVYEAQVQDSQGQRRHVIFYKATFNDPDGQLGGLVGTMLDITERQQAEDSLKASELRLHTLIAALPDAVFFKDGEGRWLVTNRPAQALFNLDGQQWFGRSDTELARLQPARAANYQACIDSDEAAWRNGQLSRGVEEIADAQGQVRFLDISKVPLFAADGSRSGLVIVGRDTTEQRQREAELHLRDRAIDAMPLGVTISDVRSKGTPTVYCSRGFERMTGYRAEQMLGKNLRLLQGEETDPAAIASLRAAIAGEQESQVELLTYRADGSTFWNELRCSPVRDENGQVTHVVGIHNDITARRAAKEKLQLAAVVFDSTAEGVCITSPRGDIVSVNQAFERITGYTQGEVLGQNPRLLNSGRHKADFYDAMWQALALEGHWQGEVWNRRKNGEVYPQLVTISAVRGEEQELKYYVAVFTDITQIKDAQSQLERLAHYDPLTELPNRSLLGDRLEHAIGRARRGKSTVAVLLLDLDGFKNVNDSLGHPAGDRLLQVVAQRLKAILREEDTVARMGGDEFALVMEDVRHGEEMSELAERLIAALAEPVELDGHSARISASVGIALYPQDGDDAMTLFKAADTAMYQSKQGGRNTYRFHHHDMAHAARRRLELEYGMRRALEQGEYELWYQPQIELHSGRVIGLEALLRWRDPQRGLVPPLDFIPLAEENGMIVALGEWVLRTACQQALQWRQAGLVFGRMAVNVAASQIERGDFESTVQRVLQETGLPAEALELEITESLLLNNADNARKVIAGLRAMGISLAIDDFGTGYSSLAYLKHLSIDKLKIDRAFVTDLPADAGNVAITRAIVALGHSLGFSVIAEGVENEANRAFLQAEGCEQGQGYLFSKPLPATDCASWLAADLGREAFTFEI
jgi:diguanylate cyclase (GGDEF)-like protein/PAS domain S-box-containing protein